MVHAGNAHVYTAYIRISELIPGHLESSCLFIYLAVLRMELTVSHTLGKCLTTELYPQPNSVLNPPFNCQQSLLCVSRWEKC